MLPCLNNCITYPICRNKKEVDCKILAKWLWENTKLKHEFGGVYYKQLIVPDTGAKFHVSIFDISKRNHIDNVWFMIGNTKCALRSLIDAYEYKFGKT